VRAKSAGRIDQYYGHDFSIDGILHEIETGEIDYQSLQASGDAYSQPVVRLISALFADAVERGASDISIEPEQSFLRIPLSHRWGAAPDKISAQDILAGHGGAYQGDVEDDIAETRAPRRAHLR